MDGGGTRDGEDGAARDRRPDAGPAHPAAPGKAARLPAIPGGAVARFPGPAAVAASRPIQSLAGRLLRPARPRPPSPPRSLAAVLHELHSELNGGRTRRLLPAGAGGRRPGLLMPAAVGVALVLLGAIPLWALLPDPPASGAAEADTDGVALAATVAIPAPVPAPALVLGPGTVAGAPAPPEAPRMPALPEALLLARGDELLAQGDLASARLFYERAAEDGSGRAALALGRAHDPRLLPPARGGVGPDAALAARWYRRAAEAGQDGAARHLRDLDAWQAGQTPTAR